MVKGRADADVVGVQADGRAGEQVHAAEVRAFGDKSRLVVQPPQEREIFADGGERLGGLAERHAGTLALGPPMDGFDAVRKVDSGETKRRLVGGLRLVVRTQQRHRFEPRQRERHTRAP